MRGLKRTLNFLQSRAVWRQDPTFQSARRLFEGYVFQRSSFLKYWSYRPGIALGLKGIQSSFRTSHGFLILHFLNCRKTLHKMYAIPCKQNHSSQISGWLQDMGFEGFNS